MIHFIYVCRQLTLRRPTQNSQLLPYAHSIVYYEKESVMDKHMTPNLFQYFQVDRSKEEKEKL